MRILEISYRLDVDPIPQARPRVGRYGAYEPKRCTKYKQEIKKKAAAAMTGKEPLTGEIDCLIRVFRKVKSTSRNFGDVDNHIKSILDGMNGICYQDDRQITKCTIEKETDPTPHIEVVLKNANI